MAIYETRKTLKQGGVAKTTKADPKFNYVDNEQFYADIKDYLIKREVALEAGLSIPQIPNSIGKVFSDIAMFNSRKHNFINYSYKDEMIADAVANMCTYVHKFDYRNRDNPFAYFTQACFNSFIFRIKKEKHQTLVKASIASSLGTLLDDISQELQDEDSHFVNASTELLQLRSSDVIAKHEDSVKAAKLKKLKQHEMRSVEDIMSHTDE